MHKSHDHAQKTRIRAVIKLKEGMTKTAVAKEMVIGRTVLIEWVKQYNHGGVSSLIFNKGGRSEGNPKWNPNIFTELAIEIDKGGYWSIPRMQEWIKKTYEKDIPEQTVWYRMNKLDIHTSQLVHIQYKETSNDRKRLKKGAHPVLGAKVRLRTLFRR